MVDFNELLETEVRHLGFDSIEPAGLYEPLAYVLEGGGKRLRPNLFLLSYLACGGRKDDLDVVMPAAFALEFFHNFTLIHDDVMDHAETRRGKTCVHVRWNEQTAILSGDQLLIEAYKQLTNLPISTVYEASVLFNEMATQVCEGQQMDMDFEHAHPTLHDYVDMVSLKTGALLSCACIMGAYFSQAGCDDSEDHSNQPMGDFGRNLGIAFQIMDDYLDCFGTEERLGKPIGGDIREHKKTWLYLMAETILQEGKILELPDGYDILDSGNYEAVTTLYRHLGVDRMALDIVKAYTDQALDDIDFLPEDNIYATKLRSLARNLTIRNK